MKTMKAPIVELGGVIRNQFIAELESLRSHDCEISYTERKGFFFTYLTNLVITGPDHVVDWFVQRTKDYEA